MAKKSKKFVVATEGATVDGRTIERDWITQMAATYNPAIYRAGVNLEHYRSASPDSTFRNYGFVDALETKDGLDGKLQLVATIAPTDDLVKLTAAWQKVFTSIEVDPNFAKTGKAYLMGLAVTDTPASLGTEMLNFTATNPAGSPLTARKLRPENHFSAGAETVIEFEEVEEAPGLLERVKALLSRKDMKDGERYTDIQGAIEEIANSGAAQSTANAREFERVDGEVTRLRSDNAALVQRVEQLEAHFATTPADRRTRERADGGAESLTAF